MLPLENVAEKHSMLLCKGPALGASEPSCVVLKNLLNFSDVSAQKLPGTGTSLYEAESDLLIQWWEKSHVNVAHSPKCLWQLNSGEHSAQYL